MEQYKKELMFRLLSEYKEEKRQKHKEHFKSQVALLKILVAGLGVLLVVGFVVR